MKIVHNKVKMFSQRVGELTDELDAILKESPTRSAAIHEIRKSKFEEEL